MAKLKRRSDCPISYALDIFGDKWTLLIIRDIVFRDKHYFGEFLKSEEKIATNILTDRLSLLEQGCIITKKVDPNNGSKFIYRISKKGIDLLPVLLELILWSSKYDDKVSFDANLISSAKKDKSQFLKEITTRLKKEMAS